MNPLSGGGEPYVRPDCRFFNGYKPCEPGMVCTPDCAKFRSWGTRILLINLDQMGDVLQTTCLLPAIRRAWPESHLTWVTGLSAAPILGHNPLVDRVVPFVFDEVYALEGEAFDVLLNADKSRPSANLAERVRAPIKRGFGLAPQGAIRPLNPEAHHLYALGLDDRLKFHVNRRTGQSLLAEAFGLDYRREEYILILSETELESAAAWRREAGIAADTPIVGFNTGCSPLYPNKKLFVEQQIAVCDALAKARPDAAILLLGGRDEIERNASIAERTRAPVFETPTDRGVRMGVALIDLCDAVITGDTFAMHAAIALKKRVVVHFGLSCEQEVDLFGRGVKLWADVGCRPCWKRECDVTPELACLYDLDLDRLVALACACLDRARERRAASSS